MQHNNSIKFFFIIFSYSVKFKKRVNLAETKVWLLISDFDVGGITLEEEVVQEVADLDRDTAALVPLAVNPELPGRRSNLDLVFLPVQLKLLVALVDPVEDDHVLVVDNHPPVLLVREEDELAHCVVTHYDGGGLLVEPDHPQLLANGQTPGLVGLNHLEDVLVCQGEVVF